MQHLFSRRGKVEYGPRVPRYLHHVEGKGDQEVGDHIGTRPVGATGRLTDEDLALLYSDRQPSQALAGKLLLWQKGQTQACKCFTYSGTAHLRVFKHPFKEAAFPADKCERDEAQHRDWERCGGVTPVTTAISRQPARIGAIGKA